LFTENELEEIGLESGAGCTGAGVGFEVLVRGVFVKGAGFASGKGVVFGDELLDVSGDEVETGFVGVAVVLLCFPFFHCTFTNSDSNTVVPFVIATFILTKFSPFLLV
jgi:hypothetical protein